jgi:isopenicillin-N epimerase
VKELWLLDPFIVFLNHGSFGATPREVLEKQTAYRMRMEREPVRFLARELEPLLDAARSRVASFVGADAESLVFLPNATAGVNAVLRSLDLDQHDELLVTNQEYNASRNTLDYVAQLAGSKVVVVDLPFPIASPDDAVDRIVSAVTNRTRLLLIDHITSQTALVLPIERIVAEMNRRGIDTLVDGAHAPGMVPLDLRALDAAYYTGNLHKWVCAPKGAAFLSIRANRRRGVRPIAISHGANSMRTDRSRMWLEFDWTGTFDPSAWLAAADAIDYVGSLVIGGWPEVMHRNRMLALRGRDILASHLSVAPPAPDSMIGSMAALPLPDGDAATAPSLYGDPLQDVLLESHHIEVPLVPWPHPPKRIVRVSAHLYNTESEYDELGRILRTLL